MLESGKNWSGTWPCLAGGREGGAAPRLRQEGPSSPSLDIHPVYNFSKQPIFGKQSNGILEQKGLEILYLRLFRKGRPRSYPLLGVHIHSAWPGAEWSVFPTHLTCSCEAARLIKAGHDC